MKKLCLMSLVIACSGIAPGCGQAVTATDDVFVGIDGGANVDVGTMPMIDTGTPAIDTGPPPVDVGHDAPAPEPCTTPGATESVPCGMCGSVTRFCAADHTWAYGACTGESGVCMPGTTQSVPCGMCGTQTANCDTTCQWMPTGACSGEGTCAPGTLTRTSTGCPSGQTQDVRCDATCTYQPIGACSADACPTAGASESTPCGMCGSVMRFCDASHVWQYGTCMGEGVCVAGTTGSAPCGNCGTRPASCDTTCQYVPTGTCTGEGVCAPGATMVTSVGCPSGQTRTVQCGSTCDYTVDVSPCAATHPVDVTIVLDITGSNMGALTSAIPMIESACITPLLAITDVNVGISFSGEYPVMPYGEADCRPFIGGIEPTADAARIMSTITGRGMMVGGDFYDGTLAVFSMLSGGPMELGAAPLVCSAGRAAGGCWRSGAARVVAIHTDSPMHGGPAITGTGVAMPYAGVTPTPVTWPMVRTEMEAQGVVLVVFDSAGAGGTGDERTQYTQMLSDLSQPATDLHATPDSASVGTACGQLVARVRALAGM